MKIELRELIVRPIALRDMRIAILGNRRIAGMDNLPFIRRFVANIVIRKTDIVVIVIVILGAL